MQATLFKGGGTTAKNKIDCSTDPAMQKQTLLLVKDCLSPRTDHWFAFFGIFWQWTQAQGILKSIEMTAFEANVIPFDIDGNCLPDCLPIPCVIDDGQFFYKDFSAIDKERRCLKRSSFLPLLS